MTRDQSGQKQLVQCAKFGGVPFMLKSKLPLCLRAVTRKLVLYMECHVHLRLVFSFMGSHALFPMKAMRELWLEGAQETY